VRLAGPQAEGFYFEAFAVSGFIWDFSKRYVSKLEDSPPSQD
jgi:hypothetical protein